MSPGLLYLCKEQWKVIKHKPRLGCSHFCLMQMVTFTQGEQQATYTPLHTKSVCCVQHAHIYACSVHSGCAAGNCQVVTGQWSRRESGSALLLFYLTHAHMNSLSRHIDWRFHFLLGWLDACSYEWAVSRSTHACSLRKCGKQLTGGRSRESGSAPPSMAPTST